MKRLTVILGLVLALFISLPLNASAANYVKDGDVYKSDANIGVGKYGTIMTGDATYKYTNETDKIKTWTFYVTAGEEIDYVAINLLPVSLEIQSIKVGQLFNNLSSNKEKILMEVKSAGSVKKGDRIELFTVVTKDTADKGCTLSLSPQNIEACKVVDGNYFDKNGKRVTEAEYKASCESSETPNPLPPDVPNPNPPTGSVVPYMAIGGGLIAIAGVYFYSKKANKMYKL